MRKGVRGNNILRLEDERYKSDNTGKFDRSESLRKWLEKNSRSMNSEEKRVVGLLLGGESEKLEGLRKISSMEIRLPIDIVSAFLYDESEKIRLGALETLLALGKISDISRVIELASDPSERVREKACSLLGYGGKESVSVLIDALMDGNVKVRRAAACSLERCVHENMAQIDIKRIVANLDDCDDEVCEYISRSLKRIGKASVPALVSMVLSAEIPSQRKMLEVLSSFEDTRCREIFRMFVSDSDRIAREHAANGLLKIAENRDIEALVEVFSSDRKKIDTFVDMLLKLPGKGIKELESCLNSVNPNSRAFAIMCLSRLGEYRHGEVDTEICD
ncbi:MAG: HEAT repeat domain-containing protein, partial [Thermoplasmata archaeon]